MILNVYCIGFRTGSVTEASEAAVPEGGRRPKNSGRIYRLIFLIKVVLELEVPRMRLCFARASEVSASQVDAPSATQAPLKLKLRLLQSRNCGIDAVVSTYDRDVEVHLG